MQKATAGMNPITIEEDLVYSISYEPSTLAVTQAFFAAIEPVFTTYGHVFMLTDATRTFAVTAEARRAIAEWGKTHRVAASAVFGPSAVSRAMLTLITSAMKLVGNADQNIRFFATEAAARTWIDEQRREFSARRAKSSS